MATLELYLIRHAVAANRGDRWPDDAKRPLTPGGMAKMRKAAKGLVKLGVEIDEILSSPLVRARQTADIVAEMLKAVPPISVCDALAPAGTPAAVMQEIAKHARKGRLALVGHEPNISELAAQLIGTRTPIVFKKGSICRIDFDVLPPKGHGRLVWLATPKMLRRMA
ncbi:MAG TPA: phosphohistidine phosphatase SixA [Vicinamibacterales bacterium]|nr:phosphohistidine phosphatase SixA [Vicinamibacterales bacterium]